MKLEKLSVNKAKTVGLQKSVTLICIHLYMYVLLHIWEEGYQLPAAN